jgi:hypothetical protein
VQSSTTARMRKRRASVSWSETKSRPSAGWGQRRRDRPPRSHRPLAAAAPAHRQSLLTIEPLYPLLVARCAYNSTSADTRHLSSTTINIGGISPYCRIWPRRGGRVVREPLRRLAGWKSSLGLDWADSPRHRGPSLLFRPTRGQSCRPSSLRPSSDALLPH